MSAKEFLIKYSFQDEEEAKDEHNEKIAKFMEAYHKASLRELIKEMELRVAALEYYRDLYEKGTVQYGYWDGKRSEAAFMIDKLCFIAGE